MEKNNKQGTRLSRAKSFAEHDKNHSSTLARSSSQRNLSSRQSKGEDGENDRLKLKMEAAYSAYLRALLCAHSTETECKLRLEKKKCKVMRLMSDVNNFKEKSDKVWGRLRILQELDRKENLAKSKMDLTNAVKVEDRFSQMEQKLEAILQSLPLSNVVVENSETKRTNVCDQLEGMMDINTKIQSGLKQFESYEEASKVAQSVTSLNNQLREMKIQCEEKSKELEKLNEDRKHLDISLIVNGLKNDSDDEDGGNF